MPTKQSKSRTAAAKKRSPSKKPGTTAAKKTTTRGKQSKAQAGASRSGNRTARTSNASNKGQVTTDREEIRRWVEARGGYPATVSGTGGRGEEAGVLRIDYPGFSGTDTLERISWEEFFEKFDEAQLAFLYQDETKDGGPSRFSKLIDRNEMQARER